MSRRTMLEILAVVFAALLQILTLWFGTGCRYTSTLEPIEGSVTVTTQPR